MQKIVSKENPLIKHIIKLKEKKYRNEYNEFIIEGVKITKEAIKEKASIKNIIVNEELLSNGLIQRYLKEDLKKYEYIQVPNTIFKELTDVDNPQGILAVIEKSKKNLEFDVKSDIILAIDNIQDPGNLGTIIRTADSAGVNQILISKGTVDPYNLKVIRSTMGSIFRVKIVDCEDLAKELKNLKKDKFKILATSLNANKSIYDVKLKDIILVIGNEANGISKEILEIADEKIIIPMVGKTESLNAAVATGIVLYEYMRQKLY